jgi:hypothetical protein
LIYWLSHSFTAPLSQPIAPKCALDLTSVSNVSSVAAIGNEIWVTHNEGPFNFNLTDSRQFPLGSISQISNSLTFLVGDDVLGLRINNTAFWAVADYMAVKVGRQSDAVRLSSTLYQRIDMNVDANGRYVVGLGQQDNSISTTWKLSVLDTVSLQVTDRDVSVPSAIAYDPQIRVAVAGVRFSFAILMLANLFSILGRCRMEWSQLQTGDHLVSASMILQLRLISP